jgi:hypothetical protein
MKTRAEKIEEFLRGLKTEVDVLNYVDCDNVSSYDDVFEQIQDNNGFDIEILYYGSAMEYLSENDPSLNESLEIAAEYGYEASSLNSEVLASLLASKYALEEFQELEDEIQDFFDELEDDEDEEEEDI